MKQKCDIGGSNFKPDLSWYSFNFFEPGYIKVYETSTGIKTKNMNMFWSFFHYIFAIYLEIIHLILHTGIKKNSTGIKKNSKFSYGNFWWTYISTIIAYFSCKVPLHYFL